MGVEIDIIAFNHTVLISDIVSSNLVFEWVYVIVAVSQKLN